MIELQVENFLPEDRYKQLKEFSLTCNFIDETNPVDGVSYPHICKEIPLTIQGAVFTKLKDLGFACNNPVIFLRMSPEGVPVPHPVHHDLSMGKYSLMLYLNDNPEAGTATVRHAPTGVAYAPQMEELANVMAARAHNLDEWITIDKVDAKQNRAAIFDAGFFHAALPVGGFGSDQSDARIVLTVFFS